MKLFSMQEQKYRPVSMATAIPINSFLERKERILIIYKGYFLRHVVFKEK